MSTLFRSAVAVLAAMTAIGCAERVEPSSKPVTETESTAAAAPAVADPYVTEIDTWHAERVGRLQRLQGWLALVGLHWVEEGTHSLGSAKDSGIVLNTGPERLGEIRRDGDVVVFTPAAGVGATIDDRPIEGEVVLPADSSGQVVRVTFRDGKANFQLIERGGRYGLRVRDVEAPTLTGFTGIERYPVDASWRYEARWIPHPEGRTIDIATVLNTIEPMPNIGAVEFERDGKLHRLEVVDEGDGALFVIFSDRTNAKETYGAGRFLYADPLDDQRVVLDFNKAYNPPCALNAYSTCPLPPPENRLDLAVTAGEKRYQGPH